MASSKNIQNFLKDTIMLPLKNYMKETFFKQSTSLTDIDVDCWRNIISHLNLQDVSSILRTSSTLNSIIKEIDIEEIIFKEPVICNNKKILNRINKKCNIATHSFDFLDEVLDDDTINRVVQIELKNTLLSPLVFYNINKMQNLVKLVLTKCNLRSDSLMHITNPKLEYLDLSHNYIDSFERLNLKHKLKTLIINYNRTDKIDVNADEKIIQPFCSCVGGLRTQECKIHPCTCKFDPSVNLIGCKMHPKFMPLANSGVSKYMKLYNNSMK